MKKTCLIILAFAALFITGCKKDSSNKPSGSTASNSYLPVTSGSTWRYLIDIAAGGTDTLTIKMTGATATINGKTYYSATSASKTLGSSPGYFYSANHIFAMRGTNAAAGFSIELQLLNDTVAVGHTWTTSPTDNGYINGYPARTVNTIVEKNISKVIGGKNFTNVMHTQIDLQYDFGSGFESFGGYDVYLAKGIGMIELDSSILGTLYETETIMDYTVK
jgi:hypothetical protein